MDEWSCGMMNGDERENRTHSGRGKRAVGGSWPIRDDADPETGLILKTVTKYLK